MGWRIWRAGGLWGEVQLERGFQHGGYSGVLWVGDGSVVGVDQEEEEEAVVVMEVEVEVEYISGRFYKRSVF